VIENKDLSESVAGLIKGDSAPDPRSRELIAGRPPPVSLILCSRKTDVLIAGGGPGGLAAAEAIARRGVRVNRRRKKIPKSAPQLAPVVAASSAISRSSASRAICTTPSQSAASFRPTNSARFDYPRTHRLHHRRSRRVPVSGRARHLSRCANPAGHHCPRADSRKRPCHRSPYPHRSRI